MEIVTNGQVVWVIDWCSKVIETGYKRFEYGNDVHGFISHVECVMGLQSVAVMGEV